MIKKKPNTPSDKSPATAPKNPKGDGGPMDTAVLEKLVKLMRTNDLTTMEVSDGDRRILLKRGGEATYIAAPAASAPRSSVAETVAAVDENAGLIPIKSIMVGTFYTAPSPDSPAFVQIGSHVSEDTDVCVIEAMKVFNTIKAECRGKIAKVLVANGQTVEFGQPLFLVQP